LYNASLLNREQIRRSRTSLTFRLYARRLVRALLLVAVCALALTTLSAIPAALIRGNLDDGRAWLMRGRSALVAGDAMGAEASFSRAERAFARAGSNPTRFLLDLAAAVPFLGRTPDALLSLTRMGEEMSAAGLDISRGLSRLPRGISSLGLSGGRIPVDTLRNLAPIVHRARLGLEQAEAQGADIPDAWVLGPVGRARDTVRAALDRLVPLSRSADALLSSMPAFAGEDRPRRYFVAAQNSAELRGTGGLIGNFAILTIDRGVTSLGPFEDILDLPNVRSDVLPAPSAEFRALYGPFDGLGFWRNLNMTPDAPTAATLIESLYERVRGERLDGTIFVDLQGLADLLDTTGAVDVLGHKLDAKSVVRFVAEGDYTNFPVAHAYRLVPRLVAQTVWTAFLTNTEPERALRGLIDTVARGHLVVHSANERLQQAFVQAGAAGAFGPHGGDFFGVVLQNAAANKIDYFLHEQVRYEVSLGAAGSASAAATVAFRNAAPAGAKPSYSLGPSDVPAAQRLGLHPGESRDWTAFYCSSGCRMLMAEDDGRPGALGAYREKGMSLYADYLSVMPQRTRTIDLRLALQSVWIGDPAGGTYRLRLQGQHTINGTSAALVVHAPDGMHISWTSIPMRVEGGTASWEGDLSSIRDFEIRFERGLIGRIFARTWSFLTKPVFHI
jgi:hypothetical protein